MWSALAEQLPSPLREQARASLRDKEFHCLGGAVYALYPGAARHKVLRAIVALQTISDYLDNLCDRLQVFDESAFRTLHLSFQDALRTDGPSHRYYAEYPYTEQVYLPRLVRVCQESLRCLPSLWGVPRSGLVPRRAVLPAAGAQTPRTAARAAP